jgi:hypothetical protein
MKSIDIECAVFALGNPCLFAYALKDVGPKTPTCPVIDEIAASKTDGSVIDIIDHISSLIII